MINVGTVKKHKPNTLLMKVRVWYKCQARQLLNHANNLQKHCLWANLHRKHRATVASSRILRREQYLEKGFEAHNTRSTLHWWQVHCCTTYISLVYEFHIVNFKSNKSELVKIFKYFSERTLFFSVTILLSISYIICLATNIQLFVWIHCYSDRFTMSDINCRKLDRKQ